MRLIEKTGFYAIELIEDQIKKGIDVDGKPYKYSTNPFAIPERFSNQKRLEKEGRLKTITTKKGKLWTIIFGGYKDYRKLKNRNPDSDFLQFTGKMLNSLSSRTDSDTKATIYFTDPQSAQKAYWLNESGAGKSRKLWKFFGLTNNNEKKLLNFIQENAKDDQKLMSDVLTKIKSNLK